jgi:hypothetical protein
MRNIAIFAVFFIVSVNAIFEKQASTLEYKSLNLPFSANLGCGGCIRGGYTYCIDNSIVSFGKPDSDVCCDSAECLLKAIENNPKLICGTTDPDF